jgi:NAD(P)-dependent dehydrogenase (short-subunit alcohol dehydrogenase family)
MLTNQRIFVTGAAGGIGREVVNVLVEHGAEVVGTDVVLPAETNAQLFVQCDVTSQDSVNAAVSAANDQLGPLTGLAYVTGFNHAATPIAEFPMEMWDKVYDINVKGVVRCAKAIVPQLQANGGGSIITTTSWWSYSGKAFFAAYCSSKAALKSLTQSMADELAPSGVRVNNVAPGNMNTSMHTDALTSEAKKRGITFEEMREIEWAKIPLGIAGPPRAIADCMAFLLSDNASYITGGTFDVNGGVLLRSA